MTALELEQVPISDELLAVMRNAVAKSLSLQEPFVTARALLLALAEDPSMAETLEPVLDLEQLRELAIEDAPAPAEVPDEASDDETPPLRRYDTLAIKDPLGQQSLWLNREAFAVFLEGARRHEERYLPKHLAYGFVSEARRQPNILRAIGIDAAKLSEAILAKKE